MKIILRLFKVILNFKIKLELENIEKQPNFLASLMDQIHLISTFQWVTKKNNVDLHLFCLKELWTLFFSYDNPKYGRYTTMYIIPMLNVDKTYPGVEEPIKHGLIIKTSHSNSSRNAVDITIE